MFFKFCVTYNKLLGDLLSSGKKDMVVNFRHGRTCVLNLGKSQKQKYWENFFYKAKGIRRALVAVLLFIFINKEHCGKQKFTVFVNPPRKIWKTLFAESIEEICVKSFALCCLTWSPKMDKEQYNRGGTPFPQYPGSCSNTAEASFSLLPWQSHIWTSQSTGQVRKLA